MNTCISADYERTDLQIAEDFLNTFQLLTAKQQKIWQVLQWFATHYRCVFPSQTKIAEKAGCTRDTVNRALKLFEENGWIYSIWRCYRSKVYCLLNFLLKFDTRKNETFQRNQTENQTANQTLCNTYASACNVRYDSPGENQPKNEAVQNINPEKKHLLQKVGINVPKDLWCLARYGLSSIAKAVEDLSTRLYKFGPVRNKAAWLTTQCKKYEGRS